MNSAEMLRLVDTLHRDKDIEKEIIFQGIEAALLSAVNKKLGESETLRVIIDRVTGETQVFDGDDEIAMADLGRIAAMTGKQVLFQKIREAERDKVFDEYEEKLGNLVTGVVQRTEGPNLIINLGKVEGILPRSDQAPGEKFRVGERIKVLVKDVKKNASRVKIILSRTSPMLVKALFGLEVPEIADKVIEIMDIVREPGYRTKIAVTTYDNNVDCVGACVGVRGSRIKNIVDELFGEKIDIVRWNESIEVLIMNALKPAEISSMDLDFETSKALIYVKPDQQSLAIGKRGQNVRLASKLAKWELDIVCVTDADIEKLRKEDLPQDAPLSAAEIFPERDEAAVADAEPTEVPAGAAETGATESGATESGATETGATETGATETGATETGATETAQETETAAEADGDAEVSATPEAEAGDVAEVSASDDDASEAGTTEFGETKTAEADPTVLAVADSTLPPAPEGGDGTEATLEATRSREDKEA